MAKKTTKNLEKTSLENSQEASSSSSKVAPKVKKKKTAEDTSLESIMGEMKEFEGDLVDYANSKDKEPAYRVPFRNKGLQKITGGVSAGYFFEIMGDSQTGKSFLIYELMAECEKMGGYNLLADLERALEDSYWGIVGLTPKRTALSYQNRIEKLFPVMTKYIMKIRKKNKTCPIVIAVDSYPVLKTDIEQNQFEEGKDDKKKGYADMRRATQFYSRMETFLQVLDDENVIFVLANQTRIDYTIMFGDKTTSRGDKVLKFWAHMRIRGVLKGLLKKKVETMEKDKTTAIGSKTLWKTIKNRGVKPHQDVTTSCVYARGIDPWSGMEELLLNDGSITIASRPEKVKKPEKETASEKLERERLAKIFTFKVKKDPTDKVYENAKQICADFPELLEPLWTGSYTEQEDEIFEEAVDSGELTDEDLE